MSVLRGSQDRVAGIAEVTFGTTPATPTLVEFPKVNFSATSSNNTMESAQLRNHPFVDQLIPTMFTHDIGLDFELQSTNHDNLLQMICGDTWATNVVKVKDVLSSMTIEDQQNGTLFNQFTGCFISKMGLSVGSGDNAPMKITGSGMAKAGTLDAGVTIATAVTAAAAKQPMVFTGASLTVGGSATAVTNFSFNLQRQVDPLQLIGATTPREYVPGKVTLSGQITVPYDDAAHSTRFTGFTDSALALTCAQGSSSFLFTIPKANYVKLARQINTRGGLFQVIDWTAKYDTSSATVLSITRVP